jgi:hypothetical protein
MRLRAGEEVRAGPERRTGIRPFALVSLIILGGLAAYVAAAYAVLPALRIDGWSVEAPDGIDPRALAERAKTAAGSANMLTLDLSKVEAACLQDPRVLSAAARKVFPSSIAIKALMRVPVAAVLCGSDERTVPAFVDAQGIIFMVDPRAALADLPVLSGMKLEGVAEGSRLPASVEPLLASLAALEEARSPLLAMVSELRLSPRPGGEIEALLFTVGSPVPVRVRLELGEDELRSAALVLDVIRNRGIEAGVEEVDLRTGTMVYKAKEDRS